MHSVPTPTPQTDHDAHGTSGGHASAGCGDGRCEGQCCEACILTFGGAMSYTATATFGASDSPSYRAHTYTSFVPALFGRPPQS